MIFHLVLTTVRVLPEIAHTPKRTTTDMAFQDVQSAHQLLRSMLTEVGLVLQFLLHRELVELLSKCKLSVDALLRNLEALDVEETLGATCLKQSARAA